MPGDIDAAYVRARRVLLDALEALTDHLDAVILVGAQAIYLHVGEGDFAVSVYTTDGDIALNRDALTDDPTLRELMEVAGFTPAGADRVGAWVGSDGVLIDLMVAEIQGGDGRRGARLGAHGNDVARKARGLEAALVDNGPMTIPALDPADERRISAAVAGPTALLVAKLHKLHERQGDPKRLNNKDAEDVYRLLLHIPTETFAEMIPVLLSDDRSRTVTQLAVEYLRDLFGLPNATGSQMVVQSLETVSDPDIVAASCAALTEELLTAIAPNGSDVRLE